MNYEKVNRKKLIEALVAVGISIYSLKGHSDNTWTLEGRVVDESLEFGYRVIELGDVQRAISRWNMVAYKSHPHRFGVGFGLREAEPLAADLWQQIGHVAACLALYSEDELVHRSILVNLCEDWERRILADDSWEVFGIRGTRIYEYDDFNFYFLPDDPNVQYLHPIGPSPHPVVLADDAARLLAADNGAGAIRLKFEGAQVLAISPDYEWMLLEENGTLSVTEMRLGIIVEAVPESERPRQRVEYRFNMDYYRHYPEISADVYPDAERWSSVSVYHRCNFADHTETTLNWYATSGSIEVASGFHEAYGTALEIARKLEAMA